MVYLLFLRKKMAEKSVQFRNGLVRVDAKRTSENSCMHIVSMAMQQMIKFVFSHFNLIKVNGGRDFK